MVSELFHTHHLAFCYLLLFFQQTFEGLSGWNFINPGGDHGLFISNWLNQRIGKVGTFMALLLTAVAYLAYLSSETIQLVRRI